MFLRRRSRREKSFRSIREILHARYHPDREFLAAYRALPMQFFSLFRLAGKLAIRMTIEVVFPFLGKIFDRVFETAGVFFFDDAVKLSVIELLFRDLHDVRLAADARERMGVRGRQDGKFISAAESQVHLWVGGEAGLKSKNVFRHLPETFLDGAKTRLAAENPEIRRPRVGGNEKRVGRSVQKILQNFFGVHPQNRPAVAPKFAALAL